MMIRSSLKILYFVERRPQPRRRALARAGMPDKQIARALRSHDADPMQLNRLLLRQPGA